MIIQKSAIVIQRERERERERERGRERENYTNLVFLFYRAVKIERT